MCATATLFDSDSDFNYLTRSKQRERNMQKEECTQQTTMRDGQMKKETRAWRTRYVPNSDCEWLHGRARAGAQANASKSKSQSQKTKKHRDTAKATQRLSSLEKSTDRAERGRARESAQMSKRVTKTVQLL